MNPRSPSRRSDDAEVLTLGWLRKKALQAVLAFGAIILLATWRLSAETSDLRRDVADAKEAIPRIERQLELLTAAVQRGNKTQDSLLTLLTERERRARQPVNPLVGR